MNKDQIIEIAVKAAMDWHDEKERKQVQSRHDRRLRNTRLLLKNYLALHEHCDKAIYEEQQPAADEKVIDVFDVIDAYDRDTYVKAIRGSVARTKIILAHIDEMMKVHKILCERSTKPEDLRRYKVLFATFFEDVDMKTICEQENIDRSTFYRDIREGVEKLSALFFGIDGFLDVRK